MGTKKDTEKEYAKLLYVNHGVLQKEIALKTGVCEKTITRWVAQGNWNDQKRSFINTRRSVIHKLEEQMELWQKEIDSRESRLASPKEADLLIKLASGIKKLEAEAGIGEIIDANMGLINFIQQLDFDFAKKLTEYADQFINSKLR